MCLPVLLRHKVHRLGKRRSSRWTSTSGEEHWGKYVILWCNEHHFLRLFFIIGGLVYLIVKCKTPQLPILLWKCLGEKNEWSGKPLTWQGIPVHLDCFNIETLKLMSIPLYWKVDRFTWWRLWGQYRSRLRKPEQTLQIRQCCQWSHM